MIFIAFLFLIFEFFFAVCSFLISTAEKEVRYECDSDSNCNVGNFPYC